VHISIKFDTECPNNALDGFNFSFSRPDKNSTLYEIEIRHQELICCSEISFFHETNCCTKN
jgi:hypothetical protein